MGVAGGRRPGCALAAACGYGLTSNHGYVDGDERAAFFSLVLFLRRNGLQLRARKGEVVEVMEELAARKRDEEEIARWVRQHVRER